jgi:hypothetical protein
MLVVTCRTKMVGMGALQGVGPCTTLGTDTAGFGRCHTWFLSFSNFVNISLLRVDCNLP